MTMIRFLAGLALAATSWTPAIASPAPAAARRGDFRSDADALLQAAFPAEGPGAAVIVTRGGELLYASGRGLADLEAKRPITPDSVFKLGSIAKQFTAAIVLQLVAEGRVSLDDPISRFFPDFPQPGGRATVRQLLNHTSGVQDYTKVPGWVARAGARAWTTEELVGEAAKLPAKAEPGTAWEYNNTGYTLLGAIVEKATGKAWHEVLAERITGPLGLKSIDYGVPGEAGPNMVRGYTEEDGAPRPARRPHVSVAHAAGGLVGSARDLATWAQALHHGRVVSPSLYQEMIRPARLASGKTERYGFGLRLQQLRGRPAYVHGGAGAGLDADSVYIPGDDVYVAVLANTDKPATDPSSLTRRLAAMALGEPIPTFTRAEVQPAAVAPLFGAYSARGAPPISFFERDGRFYLAHGEEEQEAIPAGNDRFYFGPDDLTWLKFVRQPNGAQVMEVYEPDTSGAARAVRTGPVPTPIAVAPALLQTYAGAFQTETLKVKIELGANGRLTIQPEGGAAMPMRPVSNTEFRVDAGGFRLVFHPEAGKVERFTMYRGARELHGRRVAP
jgi:D-alanyl-D-alanine carboxypeptidase